MTTVIDTEQRLPQLYRARRTPGLVDVPELMFLMIDGRGDPNTATRFPEAVQALYGVSYTLRFGLKRAGGRDYRVAPLEGLWWAEDLTGFGTGNKSASEWTLMIRQPDAVDLRLVEVAVAEVAEKKQLPIVRELRLERYAEGRAAQVLHLGPYADEGPTIERLHAFIAEQRLAPRGRHHEIYLGDPRRATPERLKTIIRQPVDET